MKLTLESRNKQLIRSYDAGEVRVGEQTIHRNCFITVSDVVEWPVENRISRENIEPLLALNPEVVILGTTNQYYPDASIYSAFLERGIGFEVMDIGAACRTFNILLGEDRRVIAALLLTAPDTVAQ